MQAINRQETIFRTILDVYGSLETPVFSFMEERYKGLIRHPFVADVMSRFLVRNITDLNDHAALHLQVQHRGGSAMVCLSFVNHWAVVFRLATETLIYSKVLDRSNVNLMSDELELLNLLVQHGFEILSKDELSVPLDMTLFNTDVKDTCIYHAIVADDGGVPHVLIEEGNGPTQS